MKKLIIKNTLYAIIAFSAISCTEDYLTDGGISNAKTELSVYDYLKANNYSMFDTLVQIIDSLELKEAINSSGTFFAPTDYSIELYLGEMTGELRKKTEVSDTIYTLKHLFKDIKEEALLQYALEDGISLKNATLAGGTFTSRGNTNVVVKKIKATESQYYIYSDDPVYFLYYCLEGKKEEKCQTQGILTQNGNGAVLNVINNSHVFNLFTKESDD